MVVLTTNDVEHATLSISIAPDVPVGESFFVDAIGTGGGLFRSAGIVVMAGSNGPDFSIGCPFLSNIKVFQGETYDSYFWACSLNEFTGTVTLAANLPLPGWIYPTTIELVAEGHATIGIRLNVPSDTVLGNYSGRVTGTSNGLNRSFNITITVLLPPATFRIDPSLKGALSLQRGSSANVALTLNSLYGFKGLVWMRAQVTPEVRGGPTASVSPDRLRLRPGGTNTSALLLSTTAITRPGLYQVNISGCWQGSPSGPVMCGGGSTVSVEVSSTLNQAKSWLLVYLPITAVIMAAAGGVAMLLVGHGGESQDKIRTK